MNTKNIITIIKDVILISILIISGIYIYKIHNSMVEQKQINSAIQQKLDTQNRDFKLLANNIARAQTYLVKTLSVKDIDPQIAKIIKQNKETLVAVGNVKAKLNTKKSTIVETGSTSSVQGTTPSDPNKSFSKDIIYKADITDKNGKISEEQMPFAWATIFPNKEDNKKWNTGIYPVEYTIEIIEAQQLTGNTNTYAKLYMENNESSLSKGKKFPIEITSSEFKRLKLTDMKNFWWDPTIDFGISYNVDNFGPTVGLSLSGRGRTKIDLDWKFPRFGISYANTDDDNNFWFSFDPVSYRLGKHVPIVENLWISPGVSIDTSGKYSFELNMNVGL
jgi:hypothetical protein